MDLIDREVLMMQQKVFEYMEVVNDIEVVNQLYLLETIPMTYERVVKCNLVQFLHKVACESIGIVQRTAVDFYEFYRKIEIEYEKKLEDARIRLEEEESTRCIASVPAEDYSDCKKQENGATAMKDNSSNYSINGMDKKGDLRRYRDDGKSRKRKRKISRSVKEQMTRLFGDDDDDDKISRQMEKHEEETGPKKCSTNQPTASTKVSRNLKEQMERLFGDDDDEEEQRKVVATTENQMTYHEERRTVKCTQQPGASMKERMKRLFGDDDDEEEAITVVATGQEQMTYHKECEDETIREKLWQISRRIVRKRHRNQRPRSLRSIVMAKNLLRRIRAARDAESLGQKMIDLFGDDSSSNIHKAKKQKIAN